MLEGRWRGRPASVWTLVLLDLGAAVLCLYGALAPLAPGSPTRTNAVAATVAVALAATLWVTGREPRSLLVHGNLVVFVLANVTLVATAATGAGAMSVASSLLLVPLHAAVFGGRGLARTYAALVVALLAAAIVANPVVPGPAVIWLPPALACLVATEVLAWVVAHLHAVSRTDPLTGLPNRAAFLEEAARHLAVARRRGTPVSVALLDLDDLKVINDRDGHAAGDRMLTELAAEWRANLRDSDLVCRVGGDEFAVLLPGTDEATGLRVLEEVRAASRGAWSHGVAEVPSGTDLDTGLRRADARLYLAKARRDAPSRRVG